MSNNSSEAINASPFADTGSASSGFLLLCGALVFIMTPGVGLFYSGLVRAKNSLTLIFVSLLASSIVTVQWFLFGFSLTFSESGRNGFIGNFDHFGLNRIGSKPLASTAPDVPSVVFCCMFLSFYF
jgi:Amt family ammonium transporter